MTLPATDNFNRTDADPIGGNWSTVTGRSAFRIVSNEIGTTGGGNTEAAIRWNADTFNDDQYCQFKMVTFLYSTKCAVRISSSACTYYLAGFDWLDKIQFQKCIAGSYSDIGSSIAYNVSDGDIIKVTATGTTLEVFMNGVSKGTRTDSSITVGSAGIVVYYGAARMDDWEGGNVGAPPAGLSIPVAMAQYRQRWN